VPEKCAEHHGGVCIAVPTRMSTIQPGSQGHLLFGKRHAVLYYEAVNITSIEFIVTKTKKIADRHSMSKTEQDGANR